ncbi:TIGR04282 family arsenosugar biosynthesis glycosyltransferase [Algoriphagus sp. D3-2-R+10]|uniref:TIGR04282 family arsenosugar biosynthesis glycosyltransferase n=1 Tax=Algoriphagus aurantiacus TaxID=3103948 RepID=UPI002B39EBB2|nr:TIGR04282 family arsenosugar biosynthesis glycosyltransferase [Algoriphagus sp. D3-2-R+10]MEB2775290.1 TIGR04282 family arsenosugar biosynthesis glycosyltransferase [Algoriphagus sp. D3-2-R+10]
MKDALIIFQKNAELGKVKTRLAATIGDQAAFDAYQLLVNYTHKITSQSPVQKIVFFSNHLEEDLSKYPADYRFELQSGEGLGEKMSCAFEQLFKENYDRLIIIGTDCAEITAELISVAFDKLKESEVVIGPAHDGGYYLLGMRKFIPGLFEGIPWSTDQVAELSMDYLTSNNYSYATLPVLSDVDLQKDWERFESKLTK